MKRYSECKCVRTREPWQPLPLCAAASILDELSSRHQLRTYLTDDSPFFNKKHIKTLKFRIHWNTDIRKNKFLYENINGSVGKNNIQECRINQKTRELLLSKNSCLIARIVLFDTAGLHPLTFHILESYPPKDIELDLSHVISH